MRFANQIKFLQINAENLFLYLDDQVTPSQLEKLTEAQWQALSKASVPLKPLQKLRGLAQTILFEDPEFITVNEVGGLESLDNFNRLFLEDRYIPYLIEGNSNRGIDIGYLVHKQLGYKYLLLTHKNRPLNFIYPHEEDLNKYHDKNNQPERKIKTHYFSRDVSELRIFHGDSAEPQLILLLVHLKSKLDEDGIDPRGKQRRKAELETLVEIYNERRKEFSKKIPTMILGDFNGLARRTGTDTEFAKLYKETDLMDVLDVIKAPADQRCTQLQFQRAGGQVRMQIDYIFLSPELHELVIAEKCYVAPLRNEKGEPYSSPRSLDERLFLPSDHYPVVATLKNFIS